MPSNVMLILPLVNVPSPNTWSGFDEFTTTTFPSFTRSPVVLVTVTSNVTLPRVELIYSVVVTVGIRLTLNSVFFEVNTSFPSLSTYVALIMYSPGTFVTLTKLNSPVVLL